MKKRLFKITIILFFALLLIILQVDNKKCEKVESLNSIKNIDYNDYRYIIKNRKKAEQKLLNIKYKNIDIPHDNVKDDYYFCKYDNYNFDIYYDSNIHVEKFMVNNNELRLIAYNKQVYRVYNIVLTKFPIININISSKNKTSQIISNNYSYGNITLFENNEIKNTLKILNEDAKFKIRGISSTYYPKKSYTIKFIDLKTGKDKLVDNVLNLQSNTTFSLNSLYEDESKIRDTLSLGTWQHIDKKNNKNNEIGMNYVELLINNQYQGLYGLGDVINEYKLNLRQNNEIIYKINNDLVSSMPYIKEQNLGQNTLEIVYPRNINNEILKPYNELNKLIYVSNDDIFSKDISNYINIDNYIDYFILLELTYNTDGLCKNNILDYKNGKFIKIPWDFDLTWGGCWTQENDLKIYYNSKLSKKLLYQNGNENLKTYLEQRLWQNNVGNFRQKVAKRWKELRSGFLETESFVNYANSLYDEVTERGAREREHERWPDGGYSTDNSFIEKFIRQRLPYLDSQFLQYLDDSGEN